MSVSLSVSTRSRGGDDEVVEEEDGDKDDEEIEDEDLLSFLWAGRRVVATSAQSLWGWWRDIRASTASVSLDSPPSISRARAAATSLLTWHDELRAWAAADVAEAVSGSDSSFSWPSRLSTFFSTAFLFFVFVFFMLLFLFFLLVDSDDGRTNSWPAWVVVGSSTSIITCSFIFTTLVLVCWCCRACRWCCM